jgi:glycerol uptake facilitator-like aquaporin
MFGLTFILSGGAAVLARYGGQSLQPWDTALVLSLLSGLWLVVAVYFLGDISAHFNPAQTLAFALRKDMDWVMAYAYWVVQFGAAVCGSHSRSSATTATSRQRSPTTACPGRPPASRRSSHAASCSWCSTWLTGRS